MSDTTITLTLPEDLVQEATEEGLLTPARMAVLLQNELRRTRATNRLFDNLDRLRAVNDLTREDLEAELRDYYAEKQQTSSSSTK